MQRNCGVRPCLKPAYRRGLCLMHYKRWKRYGSPGPPGKIGKSATIEERFTNNVRINGPIPSHAPHLGACSVWTGYRHPSGFGTIWSGRRPVLVHRLSWEWAFGPVPGRIVDQVCGNKLCVRVDHLELRRSRRFPD